MLKTASCASLHAVLDTAVWSYCTKYLFTTSTDTSTNWSLWPTKSSQQLHPPIITHSLFPMFLFNHCVHVACRGWSSHGHKHQSAVSITVPTIWNSLPDVVLNANSLTLETHLFTVTIKLLNSHNVSMSASATTSTALCKSFFVLYCTTCMYCTHSSLWCYKALQPAGSNESCLTGFPLHCGVSWMSWWVAGCNYFIFQRW